MLQEFGREFHPESVKLSSGGVFAFDAVSGDRTIIATISTGGAKTASGKRAVGKVLKTRSDMFFLLLAQSARKLVVLTEADMYDFCQDEKKRGRVPASIEFVLAAIPDALANRLKRARERASEEVSPRS